MASLRRLPGSQFWIACYTDAAGVQRQRSTKQTERKPAQAVAEAYESAHRRELTENQIRQTLSDICQEVNGSPLCVFTLDEWMAQWLARIKPEIERSSYDRYVNALDLARELAPAMCAKKLDRVEQKEVLELREAAHDARSAATTNFVIKILRMCLRGAGSMLPHNPAAGVRRVKRTKEEAALGEGKKPFSAEQLRALFKSADDEWRGMMLAGVCAAGQRLVDIATMRCSQVDLKAGVVRFAGDDATGKTRRVVIVPIVADWRKDLTRRLKGKAPPSAPLFPRANGKVVKAHGKATDVSKSFRRLLHEVGLAPKVGPRDGSIKGRRRPLPYSFHSFRHTATSGFANAGVSKTVAMDLVGHDSAAVSAVYTHIDDKTKRAAMEAMMKGLKLGVARSGSGP